MRCSECEQNMVVYDLHPRSYRLYIYLCRRCKRGFLAHHFDVNLEIFRLGDVSMKQVDGLTFITGLKVEPRVFEFGVDRSKDAIVISSEDVALGELAKTDTYVYASYNPKAKKKICRVLGCENACIDKCKSDCLAEKVGEAWEKACLQR